MSFKQVTDLDAETTIAIGGFNKKLRRDNPTEIEGYYLGTRQVENKKSKTGLAAIHYFQTSKGNVAVWGKTDMDRKVGNLTPGVMARVAFDKMQATPNGEMYKYKVEFDPDNAIEVDALPQGAIKTAHEVTDDDSVDSQDDVDAAALAAERQAKVQAMLNQGKTKK